MRQTTLNFSKNLLTFLLLTACYVREREREKKTHPNRYIKYGYFLIPIHLKIIVKKMFLKQMFFSFLLLHLVNSHLQINLHLTDWVREDVQHHCLRVPAHFIKESDPRQIISYCMTELPSKSPIKENNRDQNFTFEQLEEQKITNQQLYLWSAPIHLIERYQFYLNELDKSQKSSLGSQIFYNCTLPYFGPQCQYVLEDHQPYHSSLDEIVR